ncbi:unnamed protein product [Xylocopa violacea]|uniref:Uncharacterized protein n=1 Tax=Xylocopa violacea TaxID=135666 RepID=A0ABP1N111_XYLVO
MSFHKFNAFAGCLKPSSQLEALLPLSPHPLEKVELPKMVYDSIETKPITMSKKQCYSTLSPKFIKLQKESQVHICYVLHSWKRYNKMYVLQMDLTKPTYLLRGTPDKMLYRLSVGLLLISTAFNAYYLLQVHRKYR